jgi:hypothetical protein
MTTGTGAKNADDVKSRFCMTTLKPDALETCERAFTFPHLFAL